MTNPTASSGSPGSVDVADLNARTGELDRGHVFHSWSAQGGLSLLPIAGGRGTQVWDHTGKTYLDFSSQLVNVNIGHQHPAVVQAIQEQAATLATIGPRPPT